MSQRRGLLVDFGGVLTTPVTNSFRAFERAEGLPDGTVLELVLQAYRQHDSDSPITRFETGRATADEFGAGLAALLLERGYEVSPEGLAGRIFEGSERDPSMWQVVRGAHTAGVRTALVSNSWGTDGYPVDELRACFDTLVISGEVGLRKPDPAIYLLAADRLGVEPTACAFVDDLDRNVEAAREVGMFGVHHRGTGRTARELAGFLDLDLEVLLPSA